MTIVTVRRARETDALAVCDVTRRSIRELCVADHHNDEQILAAWLESKTPENVRAWITDSTNVAVVAVQGDRVCGFALMRGDGEVQLCYVAPEARFIGAGKLMLRALEDEAVGRGLKRMFLTSTLTARSFYERNGYRPNGEPVSAYGMRHALPMSKKW